MSGPGQRAGQSAVLIEREAELARIETRLSDAMAGRGSMLLIEGEPGIGKTALVDATRSRAEKHGLTVLRARAADLERELAFGVVHQLFEPVLHELDAREQHEVLRGAARLAMVPLGIPDGPGSDDAPAPGSALHGLYWLCANLADRRPLLLAIDDVHWADEPSLHFIGYVARRVSEIPLVMCAASRPVRAESTRRPWLAAIAADAHEVVRPEPLTAAGVEELVRAELAADAAPAFCAACARTTGGNPFLLSEAITALRVDGIAPTATEAARVEGLRPDTLSRTLLARLARLEPDASALAAALTVLGRGAGLRQAARLADLDLEVAAKAVEGLQREGILAGGSSSEFVHPLVQNAIEGDLSSTGRAVAHLRAARLLADDGAPVARIAPHLLVAEPNGDPWVVGVLRDAATHALAAGAPEPAVALLERALQEPPAVPDRAHLRVALGGALARAGRTDDGAQVLRHALDDEDDARMRATIAFELSNVLFVGRRAFEARDVLEAARRDLRAGTDDDLALRIETGLAFMSHATLQPASGSLDQLSALVLRAKEGSAAYREALAVIAYLGACTGSRTTDEVARLALTAAQESPTAAEGFLLLPFAGAALDLAGCHPEALALIDRGLARAAEHGDQPRFSFLLSFRSRMYLGSRVHDAVADARAALDAHAPGAASVSHMLVILVLALIERGKLDEADAAFEHHLEIEAEQGMFPYAFLGWARGRLRAAQGRHREAVVELTRSGEALTSIGFLPPTNQWWRGDAALAHVALDEREAALELAAHDLELARAFGATDPIGRALRVLGLVETGDVGIDLLREAVSVLDASEARLEHAKSLVELGSALRRAGHRRDARAPLRQGLDRATGCGARPLAERARAELVAAGGRARRVALTGPDSLTPSELRVARLACDGRTNREIAQALFVTRRTVEVHLTSAYRKLAIDSREQLASVLHGNT